MEQAPALPPAAAAQPTRLSAAAASALHTCIAGMSAATWIDPATLEDTLRRAEGLLCALHSGCGSLTTYLQQMTGAGGGGGPCTCVWTAGTIAYRCRTCGLSPSAAMCIDCFRASDHEGHDYTMYTSDAGGCCDCGDLSSWRPSGCCPRHRPPGEGQGIAATPALPPADAALVRGAVGCALVRLQLALEACLKPLPPGQPVAAAQERAIALRLMSWLGQLAQAPVLRSLLCDELLQPATPSAAVQAGSLAASAGVPSEAAAVACMLQQQREALLVLLAGVLPVPGEAEGEAGGGSGARHSRPLPLLCPGPHQLSLLYWQISTMLPLEGRLIEELATLHILLLYSVPFKNDFGRVLMCFYPHLGALGKRHAVTKALDRLTVQVFHLEETTLELTERDGLLGVLLNCLLSVMRQGVGDDGRLDGDSFALSGRQYLRIAADLHMCLSHPAVVLQLLGGPQAELFGGAFLQVFRLIEGASPFRRKHGDHVLYESTAWVNIVQLEVHIMHMMKQGMLHTLMKGAEAGEVPAEAAAAALGFALQHCLAAVETAAGPLQTAEEPHSFWASVLSGQGEISAHIPLERLSAACLASLLHLGQTNATPGPYLAAAADALGATPGMAEAQQAAVVRRWEMCGVAAERVLAWMSQIRQRLWVRNGQQLLRLEAFYSSPYWSDHGMDCDLLAVQAWQACTPSISRALGFFAVDGSGLRLLRASAATSLTEALAMLQDARHSQEMLRCLADWLCLLVAVLRERSVWHPTYSPLQLRRALVHILAVGPRSHSEVEDELPYELAHSTHFDQVLAEAADYRPPTASTTGRYSLKRTCWHEFDPFFLHYTRRDLQTALHTAQESGAWQPEWQLDQGMPSLPAPMAGLQRMLHHLLRLVWTSLLLACGGGGTGAAGGTGGGAAEDCALAATHLLCMALHRKKADFAALLANGQGQASGATGGTAAAPPLPQAWATPAGFRQKCEEYLAGSLPERPGILFLLRVLAGSEPWLDGSRRDASWELKHCAAAAAEQAQQLLQTVRQHTAAGVPEGNLEEQRHQQGAAADAAGVPPAAAGAEGAVGGQQAGTAQGAGERAAAEAAAEQGQSRKEQGKQRQQRMLARMRAQQAKAAAALMEEGEGEEGAAEGPGVQAGEQQQQQQQQQAELPGIAPMDLDAIGGAEQQQQEQQQAQAALAAQPAAAGTGPRQGLPAHHPASWECQAGAECALCHSGSEAAPLGLVAQLQVTELPLLGSADSPAPITPDHPGLPGGAVGVPSEEEQELGAAPTPVPFPAPGAGPRLSVFDRQPSMHMLCCGHMLHAACLERYRSSWRQRIASGQFVEGFQLLQPSTSAGEYLCPICRRLGNCLLPVAPAPAQAPHQPSAEEAKRPQGSQEALARLEQLLHDTGCWVSAPATSSSQLVQQWQQARAESSGAADVAGTVVPQDSLCLVPQFGSQAAGVAALCEFARLAGTKWILQQHRLLEWLQARASQEAPLWGIIVLPAPAGQQQQQPPPAAGPHASLREALQDMLERAAEADDGTAQALEAIAALAGAMDVQNELGEEGGDVASDEEEEEVEEDAQEMGVAGAAADIAAVFGQLQQQAAAAADEAAAEAEQQGLPLPAGAGAAAAAAAPGAGGAAGAMSAAGGPIQQHNRRLWAARVADSTLWSLLGSGIVQWEVAHRDPSASASAEVDAAHWRALQSLAQLALASSSTAAHSQPGALHVLRQLAGGSHPSGEQPGPPTDVTAALLPSLLQLQQGPVGGPYPSSQDPFALLLELLAALLATPAHLSSELSLSCTTHIQPAALLEALLGVVYPVAAGQSLCLSVAPDEGGTVAPRVAAMAASQALSSAAQGAASSQLLPWLQRAALLSALLSGSPAPQAPAVQAGAAAPAVATLLHSLHLPPLSVALQLPAAGSLPPTGPPPPGLPGPRGVQLSIFAAQRQWNVAARPLPAAAQMLQLPPSFQAWYLSLGTQRCSACGQPPAEPALCLRCGAVVCCGGRRCHGPTQQGMCFTHSLACGGGTCCFLLLKMTRLLLIRKNRATFLASPYVDSHGEEDLRLQRGKPLSLHVERLRHLLQLWRSTALDFDSQVLHASNHRNEFASVW